MAFRPWKKNKQIMEEQPAKTQDVQRSNFINLNQLMNSHLDRQEYEIYRSKRHRSVVVDDEQASSININGLKLFCSQGSSSSSTITHETENNHISAPEVDCVLRLGFPPNLLLIQQQQEQKSSEGGGDRLSTGNSEFDPAKIQQQQKLKSSEGVDRYLSTANSKFDPTKVNYQIQYQEVIQAYHLMDGRRTPPYEQQHINNFNQHKRQLHQQQININNNNRMANHGIFHAGGADTSSMNLGINNGTSMNFGINNSNSEMFHAGSGPSSMNLGINNGTSMNFGINNSNSGMFHAGGGLSSMNLGINNDNSAMNFGINNSNSGMFHAGGGPSSMNLGINNDNSAMNFGINNSNSGMFHAGGGPYTMNLGINSNNVGVLHRGGGGPSSMNLGGINSSNYGRLPGGGGSSSMNLGINDNNSFGMFHGGQGGGGGDPASVVMALPSRGGGAVEVDYTRYANPNPPPPQNNFHNPIPYNNIHPAFTAPAPPVFVAAPRRNEPYHHAHPPPPPPEPERRCFSCHTTRTPLWRNGPNGPKSLCNACGIRYKKDLRRTTSMRAT